MNSPVNYAFGSGACENVSLCALGAGLFVALNGVFERVAKNLDRPSRAASWSIRQALECQYHRTLLSANFALSMVNIKKEIKKVLAN